MVAAHYKKDDLLNCWTSSSDISGCHADFHEGHATVGAGQGRDMAWARHDMGTARALSYIARFYSSALLVAIQRQIKPVHATQFCYFNTYPRQCLQGGLPSLGFRIIILHEFLFFPMRATCPAYLMMHILLLG